MSAAPFAPATAVPAEWTRMIGNLCDAEVELQAIRAADGIAGSAVSESGSETAYWAKDQAVVRYTRLVDEIMRDLIRLREQNVLGRITLLLGRKERG